MRVERRDVVLAVVLSFVTCGFYALYWFYKMADDLYRVNGLESKAGVDVILSIVTCGIYYIYMSYKMGVMLKDATGTRNSDKPILFLILSIFGLSIVNYCLIQSDLNNNFTDSTGSGPDNRLQ